MGFQAAGAGAEYFSVARSKVLKLPIGMDPEHGAMIEPAAVAVHALSRGGDVAGRNVLVLGAGWESGGTDGKRARGIRGDDNRRQRVPLVEGARVRN